MASLARVFKLRKQHGQALIEYALILILVIVVVIVVLIAMGNQVHLFR